MQIAAIPLDASRIADLLSQRTRERFGTKPSFQGEQSGKWRDHRKGRKDRLYRWSTWGAETLLERLRVDADDRHVLTVGLRVATTALRRCGAYIRASDAAPTQPRFCDAADLVLTFDGQMHGAVVRPLQWQAQSLADLCHSRDLAVILWGGQCSSLSHPRFAFRILMSGAAKMVREGEACELQRLLQGRDFFPLLWAAVGNTHAQLLRALEDGRTGNFGPNMRIVRRHAC